MKYTYDNILNPPEKMRLMFEAVSELARENRDLGRLKVKDITDRAGIGKGTAYEYFESKEELIADAMIYEYSHKLLTLAERAFRPGSFREKTYRIMDWIKENVEYHQVFQQMLRSWIAEREEEAKLQVEGGAFAPIRDEAAFRLCGLIDQFMEGAYQEGLIREKDKEKRSLSLIGAMLQYTIALTGYLKHGCNANTEEAYRSFVYESMIKALN